MGFDLELFLKQLYAEGFIQYQQDIELIREHMTPCVLSLLINLYEKKAQ